MTCIKFCGLRRTEDVDAAIAAGVNAIGVVLWPESPRATDVVTAARLIARLPNAITPVGVFVDPSCDDIARAVEVAGIRVAQVHGAKDIEVLGHSAWHLWVAATLTDTGEMHPPVPTALTVLLDAHDPRRHGGTGRTIDWKAAAAVAGRRRVMLAGGLTPQNVATAITEVRPHGVDVSSGIEEQPGVKSEALMRAFVKAVREAEVPVP